MILFDRKKALNQIMGSPEKKTQEGDMDPSHAMAKEALDAHARGDHVGYAEAHRAMHMHFESLKDPDQDGDAHDPITGREE